ncbi:MAG TPA: DUF4124 domain-containing protein [Rhodanobacteraceae bacterium]|jgi:hypothetical protein|nr:DUF4124 domain-containing protein [Rhodanobacteraceae bacterium]
MRHSNLDGYRGIAIGAAMMCAALCGLVRVAHADLVYKCRNADGLVAFQDHACTHAQSESRVDIAPAPPASPSPDYGRASHEDNSPRAHAPSRTHGQAADRREPVSYECRAANGDIFYRHGTCPKQITADGAGAKGRRRSDAAQTFAVSGEALPRSEACRRMARTSRSGHERDDGVSTYDRNLGRDPCRYL